MVRLFPAFAIATLLAACSDPPERFARPTAIAFAPNGDVLVADGYDNARVARFTKEGRFVSEWGTRGIGPGQFQTPHGIATGANGRVYVADRENGRIQVFDAAGSFVAEWKGEAIGRPWALAVGPDGFVYAVDGGDQTAARPRAGITKIAPDGRVVARFASFGRGPGELDWGHGIAVGRDGAIFVADLEGKRIQKWVPK